jgi:hypothetical protein
MKKVIVFTVISCLLATSMAFAATKKKPKKPKNSYSIVEIEKAKKQPKKKGTATPPPATTN